MKTSDQYLKLVQWSEEDGCYVGTCPELMHGGVHGADKAAVYAELCTVVDEWLAMQLSVPADRLIDLERF